MSHLQSPSQSMPLAADPHSSPLRVRLQHGIEDIVIDVNWLHVAFKTCAYLYICFLAWIAWHMLPFAGHWTVNGQKLSGESDLTDYFKPFHGGADCSIDALNLYAGPSSDSLENVSRHKFCASRKDLLTSMSEGGRIGYDAPYITRGCAYAWYSVPSICMILERFESVVFIGDQSLRPIYSGLNMLLRQDLAHGSLQTWSLSEPTLDECRCESQLTKASCREQAITSSEEVAKNTFKDAALLRPQDTHRAQAGNIKENPYICPQMIPHTFFEVNGNNLDKDAKFNPQTIQHLKTLLPKHKSPTYKHTAIIISLSPHQTQNTITGRQTLQFILDFISSQHKDEKPPTPKPNVLFLGPTSPTHFTTSGKKADIKTNQEIWDFHHVLAKTATENKAEVLGLWNMTAQVGSLDGERFGIGVVLTQAMMVLNWLARLESS